MFGATPRSDHHGVHSGRSNVKVRMFPPRLLRPDNCHCVRSFVPQESRSAQRTNMRVQRHKQRRNAGLPTTTQGMHIRTIANYQCRRVSTLVVLSVTCAVRTMYSITLLFFHIPVQIIYQQVLTLDLEYALDQKVEQDLWNHGFKNNINKLQQLAKDKKVRTYF